MTVLHLVYLVAGGLAVVLVLLSRTLERVPVTGPLLALLLGVALGPQALGGLTVSDEVRDLLLLESARALLAVSLIGVALRFPLSAIRAHLRPVLLLVLVVMPLAAAAAGVLGVVLLGLPVALAALLGACLCPTDPVLASGVVSREGAERDLPASARIVLTEESGANDGLALPLVLLALAPVLAQAAGQQALTSLYQVVVGLVIGALFGVAVGKAVQVVERRGDVEPPAELVVTLVLAFAVLGAARLAHSDGVLAVFAAGLAYSALVGSEEREQQDQLDEVANRYLVLPFFLVLGAVLPWSQWQRFGWGAVGFVLAVLLLRRLPLVLALASPLGLRRRDAVFMGWFGPIGVSAVFYLALSAQEGVSDPRLFAAGTLAVAASTVAHGVTAVPARRLYVRAAGGAAGRA